MINNIAIKTNILLFLILSSFAQAAEDSPRLLLAEAHALSEQLTESETAHDPVAGPEEAVASVELVEVVITNNGTRWVAVSSLTDVVDIALGGVTWICAEKRLLTKTTQWLRALLASRTNPDCVVYIGPGETQLFHARPDKALAFYQFNKERGATNVVAIGLACSAIISSFAAPGTSWAAWVWGAAGTARSSAVRNPGCRIASAEFNAAVASSEGRALRVVVLDNEEAGESISCFFG